MPRIFLLQQDLVQQQEELIGEFKGFNIFPGVTEDNLKTTSSLEVQCKQLLLSDFVFNIPSDRTVDVESVLPEPVLGKQSCF